MTELIGKSFKRKNGLDGVVYTVAEFDDNFVICDNGRIKKSTFETDFEEYSPSPLNANGEISPDDFFKPHADDTILEQLGQLHQHKDQFAHLEERQQETSVQQPYAPIQYDNQPQPEYQTPTPVKIKLPEHDAFDRVIKTENIQLNIPIIVSLPRADKMALMNEMYNISFTGYLAKQIIEDNITGASITLQRTIQSEIEKWMDNQLNGNLKKKPAKKPVAKKVKEEIANPTPVLNTSDDDDDFVLPAMQKARGNVKWDGNINTLLRIQSQEQYDKIKGFLDNYSGKKTNEIYRLEGMLETYQMENE